jgi:RNA polymerase sigma factor (sigma-70 family)
MAQEALQFVLRRLRAFAVGPLDEAAIDEQLLRRFALTHEGAAFEGLMQRHGPMVLGVCRRVLGREHDAEDAFQATFLVLTRKADTIRKPASVGSWLHGIAYRIARKAKEQAGRLPVGAAEVPDRRSAEPSEEVSDRELRAALDAELDRLPEKYRAPVVLCCLEGRRRTDVARQLGCREGTLCSRLARARALLQARLLRRGWTVPALGAVLLGGEAPAAVPAKLAGATARLALLCAAGEARLPARVVLLANGMLRMLLVSQLKAGAVLILMLGALLAGSGLLFSQATTSPPPQRELRQREPSNPAAAQPAAPEPLPAGALARLGNARLRHGTNLSTVAYSPTGDLLASGGQRSIRLWEASSGRLVRELPGHAESVGSLAFSRDGKLLASGGWDKAVRIWEVATGRQLQLLRCQRFGRYGIVLGSFAAFTADGATVVTAGHDGVVQGWEAATGRETVQLPRPMERVPNNTREDPEGTWAFALAPDGKTVAVINISGDLLLWDLTRRKLLRRLPEQSRARSLQFSPDGRVLAWPASAKAGGGIVLYELASGQIRARLAGHGKDETSAVAFSPDGRRLASCGAGNTVKLWDLLSGQERRSFTGHRGSPWSVAFSPDGRTLASAGADGAVRLWDVESGSERFPDPAGSLDEVRALLVCPDGKSVLTASKDRVIRQWDLNTGQLRGSFSLAGGRPEVVAFSRDGRKVAAVRAATVQVYDLATGRRDWSSDAFLPRDPEFVFPRHATAALVFSDDGRRLVSSTNGQDFANPNHTLVRIWDVASGKLVSQFNRPSYIPAPPLVSADGKAVTLNECISAARRLQDQTLRRFDTESGRLLHETKSQHLFGNALARSPDGKTLAIGTSRSCVLFHDADTGAHQFTLQGPRTGANLTLLAFAPDGGKIAAASTHDPEYLQVWDVGRRRLTHEFRVATTALGFSPDGKKLVAALDDGTALVWDLTSPAAHLPPRPKLSRRELEARWVRQGSGFDTSTGNAGNYARADALVEGGDDTVALLEEKLLDPDLTKKEEAEARRLAAPLADPNPKVRQRAVRELLPFGDQVYLALREQGDQPATPGIMANVESELRRNFEYRRSSHGSMDVLRQIATPRACRLLQKLADGPQDTQEQKNRSLMAKYTLDDLKKLKLVND